MRICKSILLLCVATTAVFGQAEETLPPHVLPVAEYPYWGEYKKTKFEDVRPAKWIATDTIKDGWDWSLPSNITPDEKTCTTLYRAGIRSFKRVENLPKIPFPSIPILEFWINWKDIEKEEGIFDFSKLKLLIKMAAERGYGSIVRIHSAGTIFAPEWLKKYNIPTPTPKRYGDGVISYDPAHPEFHKRYLRLVEEIGKAGIPQMEEVKAMFVGYASPSNGDEGIGPEGCKEPDKLPHVIERLDAWAKIMKGVEYKLYMGGWSDYGISKGFGIRRGFVEMYLYHIPDSRIGQYVDKDGYLCIDEECPIIKNNVRNGEENEEYEEVWSIARKKYRFGQSTVSFPYRYFTSILRLLQMRCNYVIWNEFTINPEMFVWAGLELGRQAENAPDAWCFLRESYIYQGYMKNATNPNTGIKNFERWIYQRDSEGYETEPVIKIDHAIKMWMVKKGYHYDYVARRGSKIGFKVERRFLNGNRKNIAVKVSYFDIGNGSFDILYNRFGKIKKRTVECTNTGKVKTATFFIVADFKDEKPLKHDLEIVGVGDYKPTISFLRIIKDVKRSYKKSKN